MSTPPLNRPTPLSDAQLLDRENQRSNPALWSSTSSKGMVASAHYLATRAGAETLASGGNAIDAAAATSLALAVVESAGSGLGGMGMATVHLAGPGRTFVLSGPCRAPRRATPEEVMRSSRYTGYRAVAVPTLVSVLEAALRRYGTMPASLILGPAIALAEDGFPLTKMQCRLIEQYRPGLEKSTAAPFFLVNGGTPAAHSRFQQPVLARSLRRLAEAGLRDFYEGEIARRMAEDMEANDGFIRADDLAGIEEPSEDETVQATFQGMEVHTAGNPAGGRTLVEMLNLVSELSPDEPLDLDSPDGVDLLAAIIRRARTDRRAYRMQRASDPDYASRDYATRAATDIRDALGYGETSHLCVVDAAGNAVSLTQSIERSFGAKVVTPDLGFLHNGYMRAFKVEAKRHPHYLKPGAVARSNAAPTILLEDGRAAVVIGCTGSERMCSSILGALVRLATQAPFDAVHAPRIHVTPEGILLFEQEGFSRACQERLQSRGYQLDPVERYAFKFGGLQLIARDGQTLVGVAEPRRDGAAMGP